MKLALARYEAKNSVVNVGLTFPKGDGALGRQRTNQPRDYS